MTRITKVELTGFKSFRKPISIPFFEGLTAVIGENGSGKSNLFDAISFVMGRRSSQLRADRLEHLIFNGGERYKPEDSASVILHLDNQDHHFDSFLENGDRPASVTLGRRITKASSTYLFMGKSCPRSHIDAILESAKIDPDGQQLIAQGTITEIIKKSPLRRREILDEISGIAAYDEKRRKAIGELKDVKSKLNTHRVILAERRRRLTELAHERDAALEHQQLAEELIRIELSIRHHQRKRAQAKLERARHEREGMGERIAGMEESLTALDLAIENKEWELEGIREEADDDGHITLIKDLERLRSDLLHKQGEIDFKRQQAKNIQEMIEEVARIKATESARTPQAQSGRPTSRAAEALLARKRGGVYGTVASLTKPKQGFEVAFETAAGGHLGDLVVDSRETAIDCINFLKQQRLGRARLLPLRRLVAPRKSLSSAEALRQSGVIDYAINLVEFDPKYRRALEYVLGDTVVAENLEALRDVDGVRAVTVDGDLQSRGGALTGGWRPDPGKKQAPEPRESDSSFDTAKKRQQISKLNREIEALRSEVEQLHAQVEELEERVDAKREEGSRAKGAATTRSEELKALREQRRETYQGLENLRRAITRYEREEAEATVELEAMGPDEHEEDYYAEGSVRDLERSIEGIKRKMRRLEPINMRSIDEYAEQEEAFLQFKERVDALEEEKAEIERLIGQIEERKRERFLDTLSQVNQHFDSAFRKLFDGGSASLKLDEEGNISSGLIIRANPPDKEPHVIDSLSGGEQTLVATAFIFALQEFQDAPFFILDEVDAALDMMNAGRLATMLREYAQRMQVIVVSHNEETVRHASRAYGVTMRHGVSQVLALDLS